METSGFISKLEDIIAQTRSDYFNIPEIILAEKEKPDKWSKKEILGHLIDSARYNLMWFNEILTCEDMYEIKSYNQDQLVKWHDYQNQSDHHLLTLWLLLNHQIITVISNLGQKELDLFIKVKDEIKNLEWLIEDYILHMEHHINQIFCDIGTYKPTPIQIELAEAIAQLCRIKAAGRPEFVGLMAFADLEVEYYKPNKIDRQQPHLKDEVYVIVSGNGFFYINGQQFPFAEHDVLFVKAGDEHRFIDFTDDFATWVIFFGVRNNKI